MPTYYRITVATPLRKIFTYLAPKQEAIPENPVGCRVLVPFGPRKLIGVVISAQDQLDASLTSTNFDPKKLRAIDSFLDQQSLVSGSMLEFYLWSSSYYQASPGDAILQGFPSSARKAKPVIRETQSCWQLSELGQQKDVAQFSSRSLEQKRLFQLISDRQLITRVELDQHGFKLATCNALVKKGWVDQIQQIPPLEDHVVEPEVPLNAQQKDVVSAISASINTYGCHLVEGVTGSGKTEVYISLVKKVLNAGKQAIILVPEIGLTPQTFKRIQNNLEHPVAVLHSGLSDKQRTNAWLDMASGRARVALGTRSAIFVPMKQPGIIIIDEEHDASYKQQDGFRYHARDLAIKRASLDGIPVVLGSATPSLETLNHAVSQRFELHQLSQQAIISKASPVELVDLTASAQYQGVSEPVLKRIQQHLNQGEQVLLFLNRRGFAPTLQCNQCGWIANCPQCDARQTLHSRPVKLMCHHCSQQEPVPHRCPHCLSTDLQAIGQGTARTEDFIKDQFKSHKIIRIDRDAVKSSSEFERLVQPVTDGEPCILIGTQMLAKGHHFPLVTLVVVLDADAGLFSSDFRAEEKSAQLLTQVSGRAGRSEKTGHVMIQTWHPTHPVFEYLQFGGYGAFARDYLLPSRQNALLPPYSAMAMIRADAKNEHQALMFLQQVSQFVPHDITQVGPYPAILSRRAGYYRFWLSLQSPSKAKIQRGLKQIVNEIEAQSLSSQISWGIDVDPVDIG